MTTLAIAPDVDAGRKDMRCDAGRLLGKVLVSGEQPTFVRPENLIELACDGCKADYRHRGHSVQRVLHRFNILGELVETLIVE
jgi:hypothetical protein